MRNELRAIWVTISLTLALWAGPRSALAATAVYTNEAQFVGALGALPSTTNEFSNPDYFGRLTHPIQCYTNGIGYVISSVPGVRLVGFNGAVSTHETNDGILVTFMTTNVLGFGGYFYAADTNAMPITGFVTVRLDNGTVTNVISSLGGTPSFVGFLSDGPAFTSLSITNNSGIGYPAFKHFSVAGSIPLLSITHADTNSLISWDAATGFILQASPDMQTGSWTNLNLVPQLVNNRYQLLIPSSLPVELFRLIKQ